MIKLSEKDIQNGILSWLRFQPDLMAWQNNSTGVFDTKLGKYRQSGRFALNGVADILCCLRICDIPVFVCFEVKAMKGVQTPSQKAFQYGFERCSGFYYIVRSTEDVMAVLEITKKVVHQRINKMTPPTP